MASGSRVEYPCSDGQPMTDNDLNRYLMEDAEHALKDHFADDPMVYVSANLFVYFEEGRPDMRVSPDVFVVKGVPRGLRDVYLLWEEGKAPDVVFEFTSRSSRFRDPGPKVELYERLGVSEYYVFDPRGKYLDPPFQAWRLEEGRYRRLPDSDRVASPALGLEIRVEGQRLWFVDPATGQALPTVAEALRQAREERARADREAERARQEREKAEREAERARHEREKADREAERARQEREKAERESERARQLEAEVARLRMRLEGGSPP